MKYELEKKDIENMRELRKKGDSVYKIATCFGVPATIVYQNTADIKPKEVQRLTRTHITPIIKQQMIALNKQGLTADQIARYLGVTEITVLTNLKFLKNAN